MGWKEFDRVSQREEFVRLAEADGVNFSRLCERFGISRKTGYKWRERHRACAEEPLVDRSRKPHRSPTQTPAEIEQKVLQIRDAHPAWGGLKIRKRLKVMGEKTLPSPSTIAAVLKRHDRISDAESAKRKPWTRFERERPNELWQVDFKGEFALNNKSYCYPLTLLDDHSRFSLGILACGNQTRQTVQSHFRNVFAIYGLPHAIYVDNGNPWGGKSLDASHTFYGVVDASRCGSDSRSSTPSSGPRQAGAISSHAKTRSPAGSLTEHAGGSSRVL